MEDQSKPNVGQKLEAAYRRANAATGGRLDVVRRTVEQVGESRASQAAASLAYYALFSLFPMLLFLIFIMSFFIDPQEAQRVVLEAARSLLPDAQDLQSLITGTVSKVFDARGEVGVISLIGLLWSASAASTTLAHNIDLAWSRKRTRPALQQRLVGVVMILVLGAGLVAVLVLSTVVSMLSTLNIPLLNGLDLTSSLMTGSRWLTWLVSYVIFLALYRWVPSQRGPWLAAAAAALVGTVAWQIANAGFAWYLSSGFARYPLVYGSLTTVIVLMFWLYLTMIIVLIGAHLSASIAHYQHSGPEA